MSEVQYGTSPVRASYALQIGSEACLALQGLFLGPTAKKIWLDIALPPGEWSWQIFGSQKVSTFPEKKLGFRVVRLDVFFSRTLHLLNLTFFADLRCAEFKVKI